MQIIESLKNDDENCTSKSASMFEAVTKDRQPVSFIVDWK